MIGAANNLELACQSDQRKHMRKQLLQLLLPAAAASCLITGCATSQFYESEARLPPTPANPAGELVMLDPAPVPVKELMNSGVKDEEHVWVAGYWARPNT